MFVIKCPAAEATSVSGAASRFILNDKEFT